MGAPERPTSDDVTRALAALGPGRPFASLIAYLERLFPEAGRLGTSAAASSEALRLRHDPSFSFSSADVSGIRERSIGNPGDPWQRPRKLVEVTTTFLGLTGTVSPLPTYVAEEVLHEEPESSPRRDFLDVFHHRVLSLLYRAATQGDLPLQYRSGGMDEWSRRVLALAGFDAEVEGGSQPLPRWQILRLAPLLSQRSRNAEVLERALTDVFQGDLQGGVVSILQFTQAWVPFDREQQLSLGRRNHALGVSTRLGSRVRDCSGQFRVQIGPVPFDTYRRFRPGEDLFRTVAGTVAMLTRDALGWDLEVVIAAGYAPPMRLSSTGGARLGHESWLGGRQQTERRVVMRPEEARS